MKIDSLLPFIKEIDRLKSVERQTLVHSGDRRENSAEHSWHLALSVLVFAGLADEPLDVFKAMKMALLHDIVEIDAGDVIIYADQSNKKRDESAALKRLMSLLPAELGDELATLWLDFENAQSPEARFVSALDRFLPLYSNYLNEGHSWNNHGVKAGHVVDKCRPPIEGGLPALWKISQQMIDDSVARGILKV